MQHKLLYKIWNFTFILWFITEFNFSRTIVAMVALGIFCALSLVIMFLEKKIKLTKLLFYYLLFVIVCYLNVYLGYSIDSSHSMKMIITLLRNFTFMICAYNYLIRIGPANLKNIFVFSSFVSSVIILIIVYLKTGSIVLRYEIDTINPNALAVCDAIAVCWLLSEKAKMNKFQWIQVALFMLFTLLSGTKKALLAILLGLAVIILLTKPKRIITNTIWISIALLITYVLLMNVSLFYDILGVRVESLFSLLSGGEGDASSNSRYGFIELGMYYFHTSPFWGNGLNCFQTLKESFGTYSHNNFVELLFSVGILGTVIYYLMHLHILINSFKTYLRSHSINTILSIAIIVITVVMDIAWVSYFERSSLIYLIICLQLISYHFPNNQIKRYIKYNGYNI